MKENDYNPYSFNHPVFIDGAFTEHVIGNTVIQTVNAAPNKLLRLVDADGTKIKESDIVLTDNNVFELTSGDLGFSALNGNINISTDTGNTINFISDSMTVSGNLHVNGTTFSSNTETLNVKDNIIYLNNGWSSPTFKSFGLVGNYLPTTIYTNITGNFVPGTSTANPTVETSDASVFAPGDLVQIYESGSIENDGLYEVESHTANILEIRGTLTAAVDFVQKQFTVNTDPPSGEIRKVNVASVTYDSSGRLVRRYGSNTTQTSITNVKHFLSSAIAGTGISIDLSDPTIPIITNELPDQPVSLTGQNGISVTGTYPNFTIEGSGSGTVSSLTSAGGTSLVNTGSGPELVVKGITGGNDIEVVDNATELILNYTGISSISNSYATIQYNAIPSSAFTLTSTNSPSIVNPVTSSGPIINNFTHTSNGLLTYTGNIERDFKTIAVLTVLTSSTTDFLTFELRKNNSSVLDTFHLFPLAQSQTVVLQSIFNLVKNNTLSVHVYNSGTGSINDVLINYNLSVNQLLYGVSSVVTTSTYTSRSRSYNGGQLTLIEWPTTNIAHPNITITSTKTAFYINATMSVSIFWNRITGSSITRYYIYIDGQKVYEVFDENDTRSISRTIQSGSIVEFRVRPKFFGTQVYQVYFNT